MKNIRSSIFETNSSSSHSISIDISCDGIYDTIIPDDNGIITIIGEEFGWGPERYHSAYTKVSYAALDTKNQEKYRDMLIEVVLAHTGAKEIVFNLENGYIDHQSYGTSHEAFYDKTTLKNWLFNPESGLFIDHDNH